ncbi:Transient receptor potential ca2 channel [Globisporangium polare]
MYTGMDSPKDDKLRLMQQRDSHHSASHALTIESSLASPPLPLGEPAPAVAEPQIARRGTHGGLRDDEQDQFRPPLTQSSLAHFNKTRKSALGMGHGGGGTNHSSSSFAGDDNNMDASSLQRMTSDTLAPPSLAASTSYMDKKRSFYAQARAHLLGKEPQVPKFFLSYTYRVNSFFARRLLRVAIPLGCVMAAGVGFYYFYKPKGLQLNSVDNPQSYGFQLARPSEVYTFQASPCENMVGFSALIYHAVPAVLILAMPASGLRAFEPFKRETLVDEHTGNRKKIKRTLVFQACEIVAVLVFAFALVILLFFWYMFFNGGAFSCSNGYVQVFAVVSILCFIGVFVELCYFARYREHVKMLLGAFKESDQTGDVRNHVMDPGIDQLMTKNEKIMATIRKKLYNATRLGDLHEMRNMLEYAKARGLDSKGFPMQFYASAKIYLGLFGLSKKNPVHVAAYSGNIPALELLMSYGFEVNTLDKFSRVRFSTGDLFWYFARYVVSKPVESEEENAVSIFKTTLVTPLHCAVSTGQLEAVRWLINHGAEVGTMAQSSYRSERIPPIFLAEHADIVKELLQHGANHLVIPDPGYMNTLTVLQLAYLRGNFAVAQELEEWGCDVALTPFHAAAAMNNTAAVRKYIRAKTDIDCLGEHGYVGMNRRTPLHWAAVNGATEVVELLLEAGADPNFQDARGRTPLHWAARLNRLVIINCLLEKDAKANLLDLDHMTPLMCAAFASNASRDLITALVSAGADINYQLPTTGDTALHIAVREENEESALAILASGGNIMKMNIDGLRPLDCTTSTKLLFEIKRAAGHRDVMISYTHSHTEFAKKLRKSLEDANVTTWLDLMDPSGIGGGAVWREEIARGITNAALVVCILTEDYASSEWCLKELALAKQVGTPIMAVSTENVRIGEDLQVYLYTRQLVPFEPSITATKRNAENNRQIEYEYVETKYQAQFRLLLDGVRDEIEKRRNVMVLKNKMANLNVGNNGGNGLSIAPVGGGGFSRMFQPWDVSEAQFIFISHGDKHPRFVQQLYQELSDAGIACYGDRNIEGQSFDSRIHAAQEAILKCTGFVFVLSSQTFASELVRDQLAFAEDKGRPIFPVVLNDLDVGLDKQYSLARNELYHFMNSGMGFKTSFDKLINGIRRHYLIDEESAVAAVSAVFNGGAIGAGVGAGAGAGAVNSRLLMNNSTLTSFVSLDIDAEFEDQNMAFASFNFGNGGNGGGGVGGGLNMNNPYTGSVILEDAESGNGSGGNGGAPVTPSTRDPQHSETRNFESLSSLEDGKIDLSRSHVRM